MPPARRLGRETLAAALVGALASGAALLPLVSCKEREPKPFREVEERRPAATAEEVRTWTEQLEKRGSKWYGFPDPPGEGPVGVSWFALGHESHRLEIRTRGHRVTMGLHGIDPQVGGGGWLAFGEGTLEEDPLADANSPEGEVGSPLRARIHWSCLGTKLMSGNEGVARLEFDRRAGTLTALYLGFGEPEVWTKSYGQRIEPNLPAPPAGSLRSQIPATPLLTPLQPEATYRVRVRVRVVDGGVLPQALVQLQGVDRTQAVTNETGEAEIAFRGREAPRAQVLSAGRLGYRNGDTVVFADDAYPGWKPGALAEDTVVIELQRMDASDHPAYRWRHPAPEHDPDDPMACGACHKWHYDQWQGSRHARSADNGHVQWERERMRAAEPSAPDDCRGCHQPGAAAEGARGGWEPRGLTAANHCDFCHKVHHVTDVRESGVFGAIALARPDPASRERPGGIHQVFGAAPDVTNAFMGAAWNPLFATSHLCAACHQGGGRWREGGVAKIDTFEEWRAWAGADEKEGRSCQDCHMPAGTTVSDEGKPVNQLAWDCLHREPKAVHEHRFEGSGAVFAAKALKIEVTKRREAGRVVAEVSVQNVGAGHRIPTGTWTKHVLVGVWARQGDRWLLPVEGDRLWRPVGPAAPEAPAAGDWPGAAGFVLGVRDAREVPGAPRPPDFWRRLGPDEVVDERLAPGATRTGRFAFDAAGDAEPTIVVRVVHRRGALGAGPAHTPWQPADYDEPPEVLWLEVTR